MVIAFLTDFGLKDDFVGTCHGVIAGIAPDARVIDVTHGIAPQAVLQGALVLRRRSLLRGGNPRSHGRWHKKADARCETGRHGVGRPG